MGHASRGNLVLLGLESHRRTFIVDCLARQVLVLLVNEVWQTLLECCEHLQLLQVHGILPKALQLKHVTLLQTAALSPGLLIFSSFPPTCFTWRLLETIRLWHIMVLVYSVPCGDVGLRFPISHFVMSCCVLPLNSRQCSELRSFLSRVVCA